MAREERGTRVIFELLDLSQQQRLFIYVYTAILTVLYSGRNIRRRERGWKKSRTHKI
jgi:hypothetical protein